MSVLLFWVIALCLLGMAARYWGVDSTDTGAKWEWRRDRSRHWY